jgi:hypothetical protein
LSKRVIANAFENLKTGEVFHKKIMHDAVLKQVDTCMDLASRIGIPEPNPKDPNDYFCPDFKREEKEAKGWFF